MFVASLLDAFPEHGRAALAAAETVSGVACRLVAHNDGTLTGSRFEVDAPPAGHGHGHGHDHGHDHGHAHWSDIRERLGRSPLPASVSGHAIGIFTGLAEAEARVHGVSPDEVAFHEVGAINSIADIVAAASIIASLEPARWSVGPFPLGGGTVSTAHGIMPVPAPATAILLEGFACHDDGIPGERVTPTGAAILRYLAHGGSPGHGRLRRSGTGFGTRRLPGISNCLRVLVFEADGVQAGAGHRELDVISFEVDDQSGEDLATGLERVRAIAGVHDVVQMPAFGKKSRLSVHVQVLVRPDALEEAVEGCFRETTTIGLRTQRVLGRALPRRFSHVDVDGQPMTVKLVERPGVTGATTLTAKAEADHLRPIASHAERARLRQEAERIGGAPIPTREHVSDDDTA